MEFFCFMFFFFELQMFHQQIPNTVQKQHKFSLREIQNSLEKCRLLKINQIRSKKKPQKVQCLTLCCFLQGGRKWESPWWEFSTSLPKKSFQSPISLIKYRENFFSDIQIYIISGQQICSLNNIKKQLNNCFYFSGSGQ